MRRRETTRRGMSMRYRKGNFLYEMTSVLQECLKWETHMYEKEEVEEEEEQEEEMEEDKEGDEDEKQK